jgi:hypothetical protein
MREKKSVHADSSTDSELKAVEEACREAPRTVEAFREFFNSLLKDWSFYEGLASRRR